MKNNSIVVIGYSEDALERRERLLAARKPEKHTDVLKAHVSSLGRLWTHYERDWNSLGVSNGC